MFQKNISKYGLAVSVVMMFIALNTLQVYAAQTKPPTTTSWYVNAVSGDTNSALYNWMYSKGYVAGQIDLATSGTQNSAVILDFGQPWVQGGVQGAIGFSPTFRFLSSAVMKEAAKEFARGYYWGSRSDTQSQMRIVVGTNNFGSYATYAHGQAWIQLVKDVGTAIQPYASQVTVRGGNDIEPGYSTPPVANSWVNGYTSGFVGPYFLYNYGSADGCPTSGTTNTPGSCNNGWTQDNVEYVSWGASPSYPLPQIYSTAGGNAKQWQQIALYAYLRYGGDMFITAPLSQKAAWDQRCAPKNPLPPECVGVNNTPQQAWDQLWNELNSDSRTAQNFWWSTDIKWRQ